MRDLAFLAFLLALFGLGLRRPFLLVLVYVYIDIVAPQRLTYYLLNAIPISLVSVVLAVGAFALADDKRDSRFAPRQGMIVLLLIYCWLTTMAADFPVEAQDKWGWVWKALAFAAFLPSTLRTRLRIEALLLFEKGGFASMAHNSPEYLHLFTECVKAAMADREYHFGDPAFVDVPLEEWSLDAHGAYLAHELVSGQRYEWQGPRVFVTLSPAECPACVFRIEPRHSVSERDFDYFA